MTGCGLKYYLDGSQGDTIYFTGREAVLQFLFIPRNLGPIPGME